MPSRWTPSIWSRRTIAPVASSAVPYSTVSLVDSVTVLAAGSSAMTEVRVSTSTSSGSSIKVSSLVSLPPR
jgi:hypothetical protein